MIDNQDWKDISDILTERNKTTLQENEKLEDFFNAIYENNYNDIYKLIADYVNINGIYNGIMTPLSLAVLKNDQVLVSLLLKRDANPNIIFNDGIDCLTLAIQNHYNDIALILINGGAKYKRYRMISTYETRLMTAVKSSNIEMVKYFLSYDKDSIDLYDYKKMTALHHNLSKDNYNEYDKKITELLIAAKADVNSVDIDGFKATDYISEDLINELSNTFEYINLMGKKEIYEKIKNEREQKLKEKESEFVKKDIKEVFQPKMPKPKILGRMNKINLNRKI